MEKKVKIESLWRAYRVFSPVISKYTTYKEHVLCERKRDGLISRPETTLVIWMCLSLDVFPIYLWVYVFRIIGSYHIYLLWIHNSLYPDIFLPLPARS